MPELENFTLQGLNWVASHRSDAAEANVLMLSAWNEHDEGHWIEPALEAYVGVVGGFAIGLDYWIGVVLFKWWTRC